MMRNGIAMSRSANLDRGWMGLGFGEKRVRRWRCVYPLLCFQVRSLVLFESTLYVFLGFVSYHEF